LCYYLAIGAATEGYKLAGLVEERLGEAVDAIEPPATVAAIFPPGDAVRFATSRGCSCDLVSRGRPEPSSGASLGAVSLTPACRLALAFVAGRLGSIRIYVGSRREGSSSEPTKLFASLGELLSLGWQIPSSVLVEVRTGAGPNEAGRA
jgi:hypothetical protein